MQAYNKAWVAAASGIVTGVLGLLGLYGIEVSPQVQEWALAAIGLITPLAVYFIPNKTS